MTFSMSETLKIDMDMEEEDEVPEMTLKEKEELKKAEKELQQKRDDVALLVAMVIIVVITVGVVAFKIIVIDEPYDPSVSTFKPLEQMVNSHIKYNGNGYMPCNGYVPCQPLHLSPKQLAERFADASRCHDYQNKGGGPEGCW